MTSRRIYPVILCGGSGTRLWPLSRKSYPKQFVELFDGDTLFQKTLDRLSGPEFEAPLIITGNDFRFIVSEQLKAKGIHNATILIEPDARDTAPAVLAAALWIKKSDPGAVILLSPSDHVMPDKTLIKQSLQLGGSVAEQGDVVTFGIQPDRAETGYGWLEVASKDVGRASRLLRFKEKPSLDDAEKMLSSGRFLWNSGLFMFSVSVILLAFEQHKRAMIDPVQSAIDKAIPDLDFCRLGTEGWSQVEAISVDFAIMEKVANLSVVVYDGEWSDLGGWDSILRHGVADQDGVVLKGNATAMDCQNTLLRSESDNLELVAIGLRDTIVVAMQDAVLVTHSDHAQQVKVAVDKLKAKNAVQAESFSKDHRPWGWFETMAVGERYQVKKIVVKPGGILSLQSHLHRSEHWIVVSGTARVTVADEVKLVSENESVYIPLGARHRLENPGKLPMILIEVQTGIYLGEDDIERYEDVYARN